MDIYEFLSYVDKIATKHNLSKPYVVGGVPRDRVLDKDSEGINDVDLTTGDEGSIMLGNLISKYFKGANSRQYDDGHVSVNYRGLQVDFSNNFKIPGIKEELEKMGVQNITPMKMELYSRDFTINTLLEDLSFTTLYDLTKEGVEDIKAKLVRCPINPNLTISSDPRRILRAIRFAVKFGFTIDDKLKAAILEHRQLIKQVSVKFAQDKIGEIIRINPERGLDLLIEYKILPLVPLTKFITDVLIQKRQLARAI